MSHSSSMSLPEAFTPLWSAPTPGPPGGLWFVFAGEELLTLALSGQTGEQLLTLAVSGQTGDCTVPLGDGLPVPVDGARCIGLLGDVPCWAAWAHDEDAPPGFTFEPLRRLFDRLPDELVAVAGRAAQVLAFERTHHFCGACATPTEVSDGGRARRCPACGQVYYP